ncbi:F-box only protein 39, partial [Nibea albiflora]
QEPEEDDRADNGPCDGEEDSDPLAPAPSSGQKVTYQTDPRPHFGVAWSSHSTCRPLWGSEGPCWGRRTQAVSDQTRTCPHCHLGLPPDTLRWHEFSGRMSKYRRAECYSAVLYVRSMGSYLERLQVFVYPPHKTSRAQRLKQAINELLTELLSVRAPLRSFSLVGLELDRCCWSLVHKNSIIRDLCNFFSKCLTLTSVCLNDMRNNMHDGLEVISAMSHTQCQHYPRANISSLELKGFFSSIMPAYRSSVSHPFFHLHGLTNLSLNYSCLTNDLLTVLQHGQPLQRHYYRKEKTLQTFALYCTLSDLHQQPVSGDLWASLASRCSNLKVKLTVDQVVNNNQLARILLPEIPLTEYTMTAFYTPDPDSSAKPLLSDMLPQYRHSLQYLFLDLTSNEPLDEELLHLVRVCERLEQLTVWAFLEIRTVDRLLHIRLTERNSLNTIRMRIYSLDDDIREQEDQLEKILSSYLLLPRKLELFAIVYPFIDT